MGKPLVVSVDGVPSSFQLSRVDRARLYGRRERHHLDPTGARCRRAALTEDGAYIVVPGMTGQGHFDPSGAWVPSGTLVGIAPDGSPAPAVDSTLGVAQEARPATAQDVLDLEIGAVYRLEAEDVHPALVPRLLREGALFTFPFAFRAGFNADVGVLLGNEHGLFLLTGRPRVADWASLDPAPALPDDEDDGLDDDLDFEMF